jgi:hypothetical protein
MFQDCTEAWRRTRRDCLLAPATARLLLVVLLYNMSAGLMLSINEGVNIAMLMMRFCLGICSSCLAEGKQEP